MKLKSQLEYYLKAHAMNPTQLSRKANVPRQTVANWLIGHSPKNFDQAKRFADHFNVTLDHLLYGEQTGQTLMSELLSKRFEVRIIREIESKEGKI